MSPPVSASFLRRLEKLEEQVIAPALPGIIARELCAAGFEAWAYPSCAVVEAVTGRDLDSELNAIERRHPAAAKVAVFVLRDLEGEAASEEGPNAE